MESVDTASIEFTRDMIDTAIRFLIELGMGEDEIVQVLCARLDFALRGQEPQLRLVRDDG